MDNNIGKPVEFVASYIGFDFSLNCPTAEEYQRGLDSMYGGVVPKVGYIIEWVVDTVEETETGFRAKGHFRSRPDPLNAQSS